MADLKAFAEQLVNLTVKEVNELATILKEEYGIEPAAAAVAVAAGPAAGGDALHLIQRGGQAGLGTGGLKPALFYLLRCGDSDSGNLCHRVAADHQTLRPVGGLCQPFHGDSVVAGVDCDFLSRGPDGQKYHRSTHCFRRNNDREQRW